MTDWFFTWPILGTFAAFVVATRIAIRRKERHPK